MQGVWGAELNRDGSTLFRLQSTNQPVITIVCFCCVFGDLVICDLIQNKNMEEIKRLEYLSLVSKVCTELENHLEINDKDLGKYFYFFSALL